MSYDDKNVRHSDHRRLWRSSACVLVLVLLLAGTAAFAAGEYVYDTVRLFDASERALLNMWGEAIDRSTGIEVVVATTDLGDQSIEKVAVELFERYQIGKAGEDNGLLILIAPKQRQYRFEVGYGLEGMLPDSLVGSWGEKYLTPSFRQNDYFEGVSIVYHQGLLPAIERETGKKVTLQGVSRPRVSVDYNVDLSPMQVGLGATAAIILLIVFSVVLGRITGDPFVILRILFLLLRSGGGGGGRGGGSWGGGGGGGRRGGGRSGGGGASGGW